MGIVLEFRNGSMPMGKIHVCIYCFIIEIFSKKYDAVFVNFRFVIVVI